MPHQEMIRVSIRGLTLLHLSPPPSSVETDERLISRVDNTNASDPVRAAFVITGAPGKNRAARKLVLGPHSFYNLSLFRLPSHSFVAHCPHPSSLAFLLEVVSLDSLLPV